ncbi:hypothetical protein HN51_065603 [Arachis hypogaea]|nr:pheophytinase, chloroplastic-like [Arachis hypogaea]
MRFHHRSLSVPEESRRLKSFKVYSGTSDGYVIGSEDEIAGIDEHAASKILVPGLPDGSNGEFGAPISSCFWQWKPKLNVHYEKAGCENIGSPNVLFLPGFGVGSFHYEKQLKDLGRDNKVWALDFLGQGMSLAFEGTLPLRLRKVKGIWIGIVLRHGVLEKKLNLGQLSLFTLLICGKIKLDTSLKRHPAAAALFASIMFAPQAEISFAEALSRCRENDMSI